MTKAEVGTRSGDRCNKHDHAACRQNTDLGLEKQVNIKAGLNGPC